MIRQENPVAAVVVALQNEKERDQKYVIPVGEVDQNIAHWDSAHQDITAHWDSAHQDIAQNHAAL